MKIVATIGLDIAKQVFQVQGADKSGRPVLRRKLRRIEVAQFFSEIPGCLVGIEASGSAHYWARVIGGLGHTVRLMAPQFVKPYVKSQKNDANDDVYVQTIEQSVLAAVNSRTSAVLGDWKMPEKNLGLKGRNLKGLNEIRRTEYKGGIGVIGASEAHNSAKNSAKSCDVRSRS